MTMSTSKTLLLTGAGGFVGQHVLAAIARGEFGDVRPVVLPPGTDLRDESALEEALGPRAPDQVLHLAAQSFVPRSFEDPEETIEVNLIGTLHLLRALQRRKFEGRLLYISSGDIYGKVPEAGLPVTEERMPEPRSPYAVSKWAAEQLCLQWHRSEKLDVVVARPFNHVGPGQDARFVLPALARQVVDIADGRQAPIVQAGDIDTTRDFSDVRDVVSAYAALLDRGQAGETYIVASGTERRVRDLLSEMCRLEHVSAEVHQDVAKLRPAEQRRMFADPSKLKRDTGWIASFTLESTLTAILEDARKMS